MLWICNYQPTNFKISGLLAYKEYDDWFAAKKKKKTKLIVKDKREVGIEIVNRSYAVWKVTILES